MPGTPDLLSAYAALCDARPGYQRAADFYAGTVDEVFASAKVKHLLARAGVDDLDAINFARIPVNALANKLQVQAVTAVDPARKDGTDETELERTANEALSHLRKRNQMRAEERQRARRVCRDGDAYWFVWPVTDEQGNVIDVDIRLNGAQTTRVIYDDEDPLRIRMAIRSWTYDGPGGKPVTRANIWYADRYERWVSKPGATAQDLTSKPDVWLPFEEDDKPAAADNPYGMPFFHLRNDRPYGVPVHLPAYGPQELINKTIGADAASIDFTAFPQRWLLLDPAADDPMSNLVDPNHPYDEDEDPEDEGSTSQLEAHPSAVWRMFGKETGQYDPADPSGNLSRLDRYVRAMAQVNEVAMHHFDPTDEASGVARRLAEGPLIDKTMQTRDEIGATESEMYLFALRLLGIEGVEVEIRWRPISTVTDTEGWQVVQAKIAAGVPARVALTEAGYSGDEVDGWLANTADALDLQRRVALLAQVASAAQSLGAAASLGVVTQPQVQQVIIALIGDMLPEDEAPELVDPLPEPSRPAGAPPSATPSVARAGARMTAGVRA